LELFDVLSDKLGFTRDVIKAYRHLGGVLEYIGKREKGSNLCASTLESAITD